MKKLSWNKIVDYKTIAILFILWKIIDLLSIYFSSRIIAPSNFPYKDILAKFYLPHELTSFANFDGIQYITIAREGYYNFNQAFFPFYPILIKVISLPLNYNYILGGILISNVCFFLGLVIFVRILRNLKFTENNILWSIIFILFFPTSFFLGSVYVTGFFFFLLVLFIYLMQKEKVLGNFLIGVMMGITAINGILVSISLIPQILVEKKADKKLIVYITGPIIGLSIYSIYLFQTKGDALYYLHSLPAFGVNRSTSIVLLPQVIYRYIKIFLTSQHNYQYFIAALEFVIFGLGLVLIIYFFSYVHKRRKDDNFKILLFIGVFSLFNILISTLTGTLTSTPRYVLYSLSIFMVLPIILKNRYVKYFVLLIFLILHIILVSFFSQGYFVS